MRGRPCAVERLGKAKRQTVDALLDERQLTLREIATRFGLSSSALHRYSQRRDPRRFTVTQKTIDILTWAASAAPSISLDLEVDTNTPGYLRPGPTLRALWENRTK